MGRRFTHPALAWSNLAGRADLSGDDLPGEFAPETIAALSHQLGDAALVRDAQDDPATFAARYVRYFPAVYR